MLIKVLLLFCIIMIFLVYSCIGGTTIMEFEDPNVKDLEEAAISYPSEENRGHMSESEIERVLQEHEQRLLSIEGVVGVGIQTNEIGNEVIVVYVLDETAHESIPAELDGFPVTTQISGEFEAY